MKIKAVFNRNPEVFGPGLFAFAIENEDGTFTDYKGVERLVVHEAKMVPAGLFESGLGCVLMVTGLAQDDPSAVPEVLDRTELKFVHGTFCEVQSGNYLESARLLVMDQADGKTYIWANDAYAPNIKDEDLVGFHYDMVRTLVKDPVKLHEASTPERWALIHAGMGLVGEMLELAGHKDSEHFLEESGDALFFFQDIRVRLGWSYGSGPKVTLDPKVFKVTDACEDILDVTKKLTVYGQEMDEKKFHRIASAVDHLEAWLEHELVTRGYSREIALRHNAHKLVVGPFARYPDGTYSDAEAEARADKKHEQVSDQASGGTD